jgi:hypothetical protein
MNKFNSESKKLIRTHWAKPILNYIKNSFDKKLFYLGLPDAEAYDIFEWLEFIDTVYAFQCREYPKPSKPEQNREKILALENTLRGFERKRQLSNFDVFDGYIEEVVLRGFDNSPTIKEFSQQEVVTLYNLDFCGQVTSPLVYHDRNGNLQKAFKFDAISRLLDLQKQITFPNKKFILFLTLHCSYNGKELTDFLDNPDTDIKKFLSQTSKLTKGKKSPYYVKAFVSHFMRQFFASNNFIAEFLPTIYYLGDSNAPILFFTALGTQAKSKSAGGLVHYQNINDVLNCPFVEINDDGFSKSSSLALAGDKSLDTNLNTVHLFKKSKTYLNLWKK